jgi:hypothetical protein
MKYLLLAIVICLFSCSIEKRVSKKTNWLLAHDKLSVVCARIYPVKDSVGKFDTIYVPSNSPDYTKLIDSLYEELNKPNTSKDFSEDPSHDTTGNIQIFGGFAALFVSDSAKLAEQNKLIFRLRNQVKFLKENYKPCDSNTVVTMPVFMTDDAQVSALRSQLEKKDNVIQSKDQTIEGKDKKIEASDKWKWRFFVLAGSIILGIVFRIFIYKRPI